MRLKLLLAIFAVAGGIFWWPALVWAHGYPEPVGYVNDFAEVISPAAEASLEVKLEEFTKNTGNEIAVVTLQESQAGSIEAEAVHLFEDWGIGKAKEDNGVLFLVLPNDHEMRIEVGYGLEAVLTDARAGRIIRDTVTPEFKKDNYDAGITSGTEAIIASINGSFIGSDAPTTETAIAKLDFLPAVFILFLIYGSAFLGRSKRIWPGGLAGAIVGLILFSISGAIVIGLLGLFLDWLFSRNYQALQKSGKSTSWKSSWGGFSSGHSSGGFGGFSGGSSGGGGASGRW